VSAAVWPTLPVQLFGFASEALRGKPCNCSQIFLEFERAIKLLWLGSHVPRRVDADTQYRNPLKADPQYVAVWTYNKVQVVLVLRIGWESSIYCHYCAAATT
jgi:hypothetical protein